MGKQIIQQPDGLWCIYCSIVEDVITFDAEEFEIFDYFMKVRFICHNLIEKNQNLVNISDTGWGEYLLKIVIKKRAWEEVLHQNGTSEIEILEVLPLSLVEKFSYRYRLKNEPHLRFGTIRISEKEQKEIRFGKVHK